MNLHLSPFLCPLLSKWPHHPAQIPLCKSFLPSSSSPPNLSISTSTWCRPPPSLLVLLWPPDHSCYPFPAHSPSGTQRDLSKMQGHSFDYKTLLQLSSAFVNYQNFSQFTSPFKTWPPPSPPNSTSSTDTLPFALSCSQAALLQFFSLDLLLCYRAFAYLFLLLPQHSPVMPSTDSMPSTDGCYTNVISKGKPSPFASPTRPISLLYLVMAFLSGWLYIHLYGCRISFYLPYQTLSNTRAGA